MVPPARYSPKKLPDYKRVLIAIFLHMNTGPITGIAADIKRAAAHGISSSIADGTKNDNPSIVGGIAYSVLCIAIDDDIRTV